MKGNLKKVFQSFSLELPLYAGLVGVYAFLVVHFLSGWLLHLFQTERRIYAVTAVALIVIQGIILENLSRALLGLVKGKKEK